MVSLVAGAAVAGLVGSPHCVGMCGGFAVACGEDRASGVAWHAGRLTTYAVLGAVAGAAGQVIPGPGWVASAVGAALLVWFAAGLAGLVRPPHVAIPGLARLSGAALARSGVGWRYALGLTTGLIPCGLVYSALAVPVAAADPGVGALAMAAFGLGTVPALALASRGLRSLLGGALWKRRVLAVAVLVAGLGAVAIRAPGTPEAPTCHTAP